MDIVEPQSITFVNSEVLAIANQEAVALAAATVLEVGLYSNAITVNRNTKWADLVETSFGGYQRFVISGNTPQGPYLDPSGNAYMSYDLNAFTCNGHASDTVIGTFLLKSNGGTQATATNAGNAGNYAAVFAITNGGTQYEKAPRVTLNGAGGANATAHSVIVGGVVVDIVLDNPGNGAYTTYTVVIDPPMSLVVAGPFPAPIPMSLNTDAIVTSMTIAIPAITNS